MEIDHANAAFHNQTVHIRKAPWNTPSFAEQILQDHAWHSWLLHQKHMSHVHQSFQTKDRDMRETPNIRSLLPSPLLQRNQSHLSRASEKRGQGYNVKEVRK